MNLYELAKLSDVEIVEWVRGNTEKFTLMPSNELEETILQRDRWEYKAIELALDTGKLLNVEVGEHSNMNCPVQNALDAVCHANKKKEKVEALKQRMKGVVADEQFN